MTSQGFEVGDTVEWTSQSAGVVKTKTGVITLIVPTEQRPPNMKNAGLYRDHESYVVRAGGRLYWPRVSYLRLVAYNEG